MKFTNMPLRNLGISYIFLILNGIFLTVYKALVRKKAESKEEDPEIT